MRHRVPAGVDPKNSATTIPDLQLGDWSIETKRYIINRPHGRSELTGELRHQYASRLGSLPAHAQLQAIIVDVRAPLLQSRPPRRGTPLHVDELCFEYT